MILVNFPCFTRLFSTTSTLTSRRPPVRYTKSEDNLISRLRSEGQTLGSIGAQVGRTWNSVTVRLRKLRGNTPAPFPRRRKYADEDIHKVSDTTGKTYREIAEQLNLPLGHVKNLKQCMRSRQLSTDRKYNSRLTEEEASQMASLRVDQGLSYAEIARKTGRSEGSVRLNVQSRLPGIPMRSRGSDYTPEEDVLLRHLREEKKLSYVLIAARMAGRNSKSLRCRYDRHLRHNEPASDKSKNGDS
ncbi:hypothetical protein LTR56_022150 [Elasticomyces elasticus]|nr:hypothetical protein LTR56_022150 [Elasticomyces elasticus]KAK3628607.1 hypothetical protein LTR22_022292 [Elasticomyces elasticus]KAK4913398.1 hypothetical protein LTR49_018286 [Elasticomyces elasticus]KAK5754604.1 hypothetical protein LTS12_015328 [Elasticomyces elasticus]